MLRDYSRLIVFSIGLLIGIQIPGFVDQYAKRVDAHRLEAERAFSGFQATADQHFKGSIQALLQHHRDSGDRVFIDEARTIETLQTRLETLTAESEALRTPLIRRILHVAVSADREILKETAAAFSYTVPLSPAAILCGVTIGLAVALGIEASILGIFALLAFMLHRSRRRYRSGPREPKRT